MVVDNTHMSLVRSAIPGPQYYKHGTPTECDLCWGSIL